MMKLLLVFCIIINYVNVMSFQISSSVKSISKITMEKDMFAEASVERKLQAGQLPRERYIASNRFKCRDGKGPKFEKRWADRTSRLSKLDGFRFFTLLKRVEAYGVKYESDDANYVSYTIWENKDNFDSWRTGEAFKEAHGGGGIMDFMKLLSTALFILNGGPKPAFYDAISLEASKLPSMSATSLGFEGDNGWRTVPADGENFINPDLFVNVKRYLVSKPVEFEQAYSKKGGQEFEGLLGTLLQRRDADKSDDGYNYQTTFFFKNKEAYEKYVQANVGISSAEEKFVDKTTTVFYEGKLALMKEL